MKPQKMWAVVDPSGLPFRISYIKSEAEAIAAICEGPSERGMRGYRVEKVLVTGREK